MKYILTLESHSKPYREVGQVEFDRLMRIDEILDIDNDGRIRKKDIGTDPIPASKARAVVQAIGDFLQIRQFSDSKASPRRYLGGLIYVVSRPDRPGEMRVVAGPESKSTRGPLFDDSMLVHFVMVEDKKRPQQHATVAVKFLPDDYCLVFEEVRYAPMPDGAAQKTPLRAVDHQACTMCDEVDGLMARLADLRSWFESRGSASP